MAWYGATTARRPANRGPFITIPGRATSGRSPWFQSRLGNLDVISHGVRVTSRSRNLLKEDTVKVDDELRLRVSSSKRLVKRGSRGDF